MAATPWIAAYAGVIIAWFVILGARREPTLWRGQSLLAVNVVFFVVLAGWQIYSGRRPDSQLLVFAGFLLVSGALAADIWLVLRGRRAELDQVLENCFAKTLAKFKKAPNGYTVSTGGEELKVRLSRWGPTTRVTFSGARTSRKAGLIKSIFAKQFKTSFPKARFRT